MECPFELPVEGDEDLLMLCIEGEIKAALIIGDVDNWNDEKRLLYLKYIVSAINGYEKQKLHIESLKIICEAYIPAELMDKANDELTALCEKTMEGIGRKLLDRGKERKTK